MMLLDPNQTGQSEMNNLIGSYKSLRHHIHDAHLSKSRAVCDICEDLFCHHLGKLILLGVNMGGAVELKIDLGRSFLTLRNHIREAHGGH